MRFIEQILADASALRLKKQYKDLSKEAVNDFIRINYPEIYANFKFLGAKERKTGQMIGEMQSGKTENILAVELWTTVQQNRAVIHLVPLTDDIEQFEQSVKDFNKKYEQFAKMRKVEPMVLETVRAQTLRLDAYGNINDPQGVFDSFREGRKNRIIICLAHDIQLYRLAKLIFTHQHEKNIRPYIMIWDESHATLFPNKAEIRVLDTILPEATFNWPNRMTKYEAVEAIMTYAFQNIGVSATPAQNLFSAKFPVNYVIPIYPRKIDGCHYISVEHAKYNIIKENITTFKAKGGKRIRERIPVSKDPEFLRALEKWSQREPYDKTMYGLKADHPVFALIQVSRLREDHRAIRDVILSKHPDKFCVVINNTDGIEITFPSTIRENLGKSIRIISANGKVELRYLSEANRVLFTSIPALHSALQRLAELGAKLIPRIVLIAGDMLRQGRRVNSTDYSLFLTDEFIRDNSTMDMGMQKLRAIGFRPGAMPIKIWCTERFHENVIKNYLATKEITKSMAIYLNTDIIVSSKVILSNMNLSKGKKPRKKMCKEQIPMKLITAGKDDFSLTLKEYREAIKESEDKESKDYRERKRGVEGKIYVIREDQDIKGVYPEVYSKTIDKIATRNIWVSRASIIKALVAKDGYLENTIRGYLTRMQQNYSKNVSVPQPGLNFRFRSSGEIDLLYM